MRLSLSVVNSMDFSKEWSAFLEEATAATARVEDSDGYSDEDVFLTGITQRDFLGDYDAEDAYHVFMQHLSQAFPNLIFSLDSHTELGDSPLWRWYYLNGQRQKVKPLQAFPDFDPDELEA